MGAGEMTNEEAEKLITEPQLRLCSVTDMYYNITGQPAPRQLDLLEDWFPGLLIRVRETDGNKKEAPEYIDTERLIEAVRYHGHLYLGSTSRVTHIAGKLVGRTKSNLEKERKAAELIQKNISRCLVSEDDPLGSLLENTVKKIALAGPAKMEDFHHVLYIFVLMCAESYYERDRYDRDSELFPFDDEVFDQILYNAFYQLLKYTFDGLVHAYQWLLLGALLRNECGRIARVYDSSFIPVNRPASETGHLIDKLLYMIEPEEYEPTYSGDDMDKRFPGIEWYCDQCGEHLNEQEGFDDHLEAWQCRRCGHINLISTEEIYETDEDYRNGIQNHTGEDHLRAVEERKKELEKDRK